jgi:hypothetical protein
MLTSVSFTLKQVMRLGGPVANLDDVYRKFGEASEAAQLLETELGTLLFGAEVVAADLLDIPDSGKATEIYRRINKHTLGQLIRNLGKKADSIKDLEIILCDALEVRNDLAHSFYLKHNFRRNSEEGCKIMLRDLYDIHERILTAYKAVMLISGVDLEKLAAEDRDIPQPTRHLPL